MYFEYEYDYSTSTTTLCTITSTSLQVRVFRLRVQVQNTLSNSERLLAYEVELAKLCYLVTSFQQPGYLADLISPYSQSRLLRSSIQKLLSVPPHNLDTAARRFSVAAPRL